MMGAGNRSYVHKTTGAAVTAARILRTNLKASADIASVRSTGDEKTERYAVSTSCGDIAANPGDWVVVDQDRKISVVSHADFAALHRPAA